MKKIFLCALLMMLSAADMATGKSNAPLYDKEEEEEEIGNFDFLYYDSDNYDTDYILAENLMNEAFSHLGALYRSGSKGPNAFDCSGFTSYVYKQCTNVFIGASSRDQYARNIPIKRSEVQTGDLVFFTSPRSGGKVGHVGIVVDVDPLTHNFSFIHASSYNGVKLSQSTEANYTRRYIGLRRVKLEP
jgi:hypothetical protein